MHGSIAMPYFWCDIGLHVKRQKKNEADFFVENEPSCLEFFASLYRSELPWCCDSADLNFQVPQPIGWGTSTNGLCVNDQFGAL